ncbi:(NiFe) hydrogenase maturation protein HypF [Methanosalsum zhilinae DSM 4017]|uniref:Carbamoyltransferase n=2 Tax=Methanosalsum zhilinae TaxID=39669 RepID=F7XLB7_METZD|nr:(NiFe) hydrogenase maturation protein HypF [Methanosalsum zhilinae DSM 4017]
MPYPEQKILCRKIIVNGVVQGVGFRPFVYHCAKNNRLCGYVMNLGSCVEIVVEGTRENINQFLSDLVKKKPEPSQIERIIATSCKHSGFTDFLILESKTEAGHGSIIAPDTAICQHCILDIFELENRRYNYPFTGCTSCGPRYSILRSFPFDRKSTSMSDFVLCNICNTEYTNPCDRRFNSQTICCPECGPDYSLVDNSGKTIAEKGEAIRLGAELIDDGSIIALKGYGGFHLLCDASQDQPIRVLRKALMRPVKPFAVMAKDLEAASSIANISPQEINFMSSRKNPVVVVDKKNKFPLSSLISPELHNVGIMLPYSGVHHLLFNSTRASVFVMTSANTPGYPVIIDNRAALNHLNEIADYFLLHNYTIVNRIDDSVVRFVNSEPAFIRRSRGYVPKAVKLPFYLESSIGVGAESDTTIALVKDDKAYLSQHVGNMKHLQTTKFHEEVITKLENLTGIRPVYWGHDMNPGFNSTQFALEKCSGLATPVQHHHAHIVSLMADNDLEADARIVGIALDGSGYGDNGNVWGGEILESTYSEYSRAAHLMEQPMAGGDLAVYYPSRMLFGILHGMLEERELENIPFYLKYGEKERSIVLSQLERGINVVHTSSAGRVLDAAAALLGICQYRRYQGEPAMKLESAARKSNLNIELPFVCKKGVMDTAQLLYDLYCISDRYSANDLAYAVEDALACGIAKLAVSCAKKKKMDVVGLTGGVAYNGHIVSKIAANIKDSDLDLILHRNIPCGDGGISLGQAVVAGIRAKE